MNADDAEEYTQALGQVVAGGWRQVALGERLGVPAALGLTTRDWVEQRLGGYVRLSIPERQEAVAELTADGMTQREVADVLGVGKSTVDRDLAPDGTEPEPELPLQAEPDPEPAPNGAEPDRAPGRTRHSPARLFDNSLRRSQSAAAAARDFTSGALAEDADFAPAWLSIIDAALGDLRAVRSQLRRQP